MNVKWTDEEVKLLEECYKNMEPIDVIATKMFRSKESIRTMASKQGFTRKYQRFSSLPDEKIFWTDEEIKILEDGYRKGLSTNEIAEQLSGRSEMAIISKATSLELPKKYMKKFSANFKAEYQEYDWLYQKIIVEGKQPKQIAKETGYGQRVIEKWADYHKLNNRTFHKLVKLNPIQKSRC